MYKLAEAIFVVSGLFIAVGLGAAMFLGGGYLGQFLSNFLEISGNSLVITGALLGLFIWAVIIFYIAEP